MHFVNTSENRQADEKSSIPKRHSENMKYYVAGRPANDKKLPAHKRQKIRLMNKNDSVRQKLFYAP
jgi:hypothetical protein